MTDKVESRRIQFADFEFRSTTDDKTDFMSFRGYAAVFNQDSEPLPFIERIQKGAFKKSLKSRNNVKMYRNHDSSALLATTRAGTLRLEEDDHGLLVDADLPPTTIGRDLSIMMQRGDIDSAMRKMNHVLQTRPSLLRHNNAWKFYLVTWQRSLSGERSNRDTHPADSGSRAIGKAG